MTSSAPRTVCYDWAKTFSLHPRCGRQHPRLTAEPVVIDYETFSRIHDCHDRQGLTIAQTARALGLKLPDTCYPYQRYALKYQLALCLGNEVRFGDELRC